MTKVTVATAVVTLSCRCHKITNYLGVNSVFQVSSHEQIHWSDILIIRRSGIGLYFPFH